VKHIISKEARNDALKAVGPASRVEQDWKKKGWERKDLYSALSRGGYLMGLHLHDIAADPEIHSSGR